VVYGVTANGAHADYMTVPARTLVPLPDELSFATGAAISCGTGTAYNALRRMSLSGRDTLAVFGQARSGSARSSSPPRWAPA
jgi:D-arabinose 1-dehydrogenase-like Zn-dependent alcohol dehydrogenase